ncbi:related to Monopolin complex subunit CSM1 [Saccharomycodes ludwigii]|uniref:Related to Monopolin complex subunit CSM1 n=1 Tax=Saccharomycodes ludwigii TaxID=36035 RepID=A0A376BAC8_9ASCO|nr:hypothetical protein SCDLUD_003765 [Saccharomycodes ludwigii]KAH3900760.1 hypothetical protein SCDLUD_003765 [Saccharomycodes ludwigii]SSD61635.1 related to Monopolin complex subunit CSM1 [Saccharomycodes ludwigii]
MSLAHANSNNNTTDSNQINDINDHNDILYKYKQSVQKRLDSGDLLISKLIHENTLLKQQLDNKQQEIDILQDKIVKLDEICQNLNRGNLKCKEDIEIIKDFFEHLCKVRVHEYNEDDQGLWFDISQECGVIANNDTLIMDYKLGFIKSSAKKNEKDEQPSNNTEVIYIPLLKQRSLKELKLLQELLPTYMFDTLSFPLKSLYQFFNKLNKSLNKKKK